MSQNSSKKPTTFLTASLVYSDNHNNGSSFGSRIFALSLTPNSDTDDVRILKENRARSAR